MWPTGTPLFIDQNDRLPLANGAKNTPGLVAEFALRQTSTCGSARLMPLAWHPR